MRIALRRISPVVLALALVLGAGSQAMAATVQVSIFNFGYNPATAKTKQSNSVQWTNTAAVTSHTSTSNGAPGSGTMGVALWDSGTITAGNSFTFAFSTAASYPYFCKFHPTTMHGTVVITLQVRPSSGNESTRFKVIWGAPPAGFNVDVQIKRPGNPNFVDWMIDQTGASANFTPDAGTGQYQFQSRLQNTTTGGASNFSPAKRIIVS